MAFAAANAEAAKCRCWHALTGFGRISLQPLRDFATPRRTMHHLHLARAYQATTRHSCFGCRIRRRSDGQRPIPWWIPEQLVEIRTSPIDCWGRLQAATGAIRRAARIVSEIADAPGRQLAASWQAHRLATAHREWRRRNLQSVTNALAGMHVLLHLFANTDGVFTHRKHGARLHFCFPRPDALRHVGGDGFGPQARRIRLIEEGSPHTC